MMRLNLPLLAISLTACTLAACSKESSDSYNMSNASEDGALRAAPDIAPTAAPNVAFSYAYRFALAPQDIAGVQEKHAAACEALGLSRCRITGVVYQRSGKDYVRGELTLKLAPDIARKYGKDATAMVNAAQGELSALEIGGVDQSGALESSSEGVANAQAEQERLERALADKSTPRSIRAQLNAQLTAQKDAETRAAREGRDARASLAVTPMRFTYSTDGYAPPFSLNSTARGALSVAATVLNGLLALLIVLVSLAIPIGLIMLGIAHGHRGALWIWRTWGPKPLVRTE